MSFNAWQPQGSVLNSPANASIPNVIYDINPIILIGNINVFKMWCGAAFSNTYYFESLDGVSWTAYGSNPVITSVGRSFATVYKVGSTYYSYGNVGDLSGQIFAYTSSDGVTWSAGTYTGLTVGGAGSWDANVIAQLNLCDVVNGVWYAYYQGTNTSGPNAVGATGLATSTDGIHWTKSPSNPVIPPVVTGTGNGASAFMKVNGTYYMWASGFLTGYGNQLSYLHPLFRWSSPSPSGPWTLLKYQGTPVPVYYPAVPADFAPGLLKTDITDPSILNVNGTMYLYWTGTNEGTAAGGIFSAQAPSTTPAQLVATFEGVQNAPFCAVPQLNYNTLFSDDFHRASIGSNWTIDPTYSTAQIDSSLYAEPSVANTWGAMYWNQWSGNNDQYAQITVRANTTLDADFNMVQVRQSASSQTFYWLYWTGALGSAGTLILQRYVNGVEQGISTYGNGGLPLTVNVGDTIALAVVGTNVMVYYNGFLINSATDANVTAGSPGFGNYSTGAVTAAQISGWQAGIFQLSPLPPPIGANVYSVPDCRISYCGLVPTTNLYPNGNRNVDGTLIYDVETSNNTTIPPTDSRAAGAPVDSRVAGNAPQNSRASGTYGPGE